jgi:hypothetical protein
LEFRRHGIHPEESRMYDPLLEHIIDLAEAETPVEAEVTLIVGGMLVTGRVVSEETYMAHHALTRAYLELDDESEDESDVEASDEGDDEDEEDDDDDSDDEIVFVHLRNARMHAPGQPAGGTGAYYRISLADVTGFSLVG